MKARKLKKILNNTEYIIHERKNNIMIGSPMCYHLISFDKESFEMKYALDTSNEGKKSINNKELVFIWDKLEEMIKNGEIKDIINGKDEIKNPLPVYYIENNELKKGFTDKYGWPNVTEDGILMYDNTFFKNKEDAVKYGIKEMEISKKWTKESIKELNRKMKEELTSLLELESKLKKIKEEI
jgi:hypothetical protein